MSMNTQQLITKYHAERTEAKLGQQLFAIPRRSDMIEGQAFTYYVGDRRRVAVDFTKEICLHLRYLRIKSLTPRQYLRFQESTTPMVDLVQYGIIYPFLIFIDGYFVPWEYITVIASQEKYDLLIKDMPPEFFDLINGNDGIIRNAYAIDLPDAIMYHYGSHIVDENTLFAFTDMGKFTTDPEEAVYSLQNEYTGETRIVDINVEDMSSTTFFFSTSRSDNQYKYFSENMFVFANGRLDETAHPEVLSTAVKLWYNNPIPEYDESPVILRIFHNMKWVTPTVDNITRVNIENDNIQLGILTSLRTPEYEQEYMTALKEPFNFDLSTQRSAQMNKDVGLYALAKYDANFFNDVYKSKKRYYILQTDGVWVNEHRDEDGYFRIPRRFQDGIDYYVIVLVNGELFKYYRNHFYKGSYFYCPVQSIEIEDTVEFIFFKDADNFEISTKVNEDDPYLKLDPEIYNDDLRIFSKELSPENSYFNYPEEGVQIFPVIYNIEHENDDPDNPNIRIRFEHDFYYGKDVVMTSARRFKYFLFNIEEDAPDTQLFSIDFGESFKYCNEYDKFLVFYNGRRLINDYYRLIMPYKFTTPFSKAMIYLCFPFKAGDRLEVFYLPNHLVDVHVDPFVSPDGQIWLERETLPTAIDKDMCLVWSNCRKIPKDGIVNIDNTRLQIVQNLTSTKDIRVSMLLNDSDIDPEYKDRFHLYESLWDESVRLFGNPHLMLDIETPIIEDTDPPLIEDVIPVEALLNEIIRDWYVTNVAVDVTNPFFYDYDPSASHGHDPGGHALLGISDSNLENNLPVDRPWP